MAPTNKPHIKKQLAPRFSSELWRCTHSLYGIRYTGQGPTPESAYKSMVNAQRNYKERRIERFTWSPAHGIGY